MLGPLFSSWLVLLKFHLNMCSLGPFIGVKWDPMLLSHVVYGKTYWLTPTCQEAAQNAGIVVADGQLIHCRNASVNAILSAIVWKCLECP